MDLTGKLLIAMPEMGDPRFSGSVIFICSHSEGGAMGLTINKPSENYKFVDLLKQLKIEVSSLTRDISVNIGGPVETGRGFVLHSPEYDTGEGTLKINKSFGMTASFDILEDLSKGNGPSKGILALGYSGWSPGQIEEEILQNGWLVFDPDEELVFGTSHDVKWTEVLKLNGIDPLSLSPSAGRA
ncbi:MAG: YqgE/AlgH family protein [Proteobacteria bacterium]|nr:YqgE/AlgH family protein [Pseudomonadota bacterium]